MSFNIVSQKQRLIATMLIITYSIGFYSCQKQVYDNSNKIKESAGEILFRKSMLFQIDKTDKENAPDFLQPLIKLLDPSLTNSEASSLSNSESNNFVDSAVNEIKNKDDKYFDNLSDALKKNDDAKMVELLKQSEQYLYPLFENYISADKMKQIEDDINHIADEHFKKRGPITENDIIGFVKAASNSIDNIPSLYFFWWPVIMFAAYIIAQAVSGVIALCVFNDWKWCRWANPKYWW